MLTELCAELRNWFTADEDKHVGIFTIENGSITPSLDININQYFRVIGSLYNDGVHKQGDTLTDETFDGAIWLMKIPSAVLALDTELDSYINKYGELSPYTSESFGGYSYTKGVKDGKQVTWQTQFADKLRPWRKI